MGVYTASYVLGVFSSHPLAQGANISARTSFTCCTGCVALSEKIACKTGLNAGKWQGNGPFSEYLLNEDSSELKKKVRQSVFWQIPAVKQYKQNTYIRSTIVSHFRTHVTFSAPPGLPLKMLHNEQYG